MTPADFFPDSSLPHGGWNPPNFFPSTRLFPHVSLGDSVREETNRKIAEMREQIGPIKREGEETTSIHPILGVMDIEEIKRHPNLAGSYNYFSYFHNVFSEFETAKEVVGMVGRYVDRKVFKIATKLSHIKKVERVLSCFLALELIRIGSLRRLTSENEYVLAFNDKVMMRCSKPHQVIEISLDPENNEKVEKLVVRFGQQCAFTPSIDKIKKEKYRLGIQPTLLKTLIDTLGENVNLLPVMILKKMWKPEDTDFKTLLQFEKEGSESDKKNLELTCQLTKEIAYALENKFNGFFKFNMPGILAEILRIQSEKAHQERPLMLPILQFKEADEAEDPIKSIKKDIEYVSKVHLSLFQLTENFKIPTYDKLYQGCHRYIPTVEGFIHNAESSFYFCLYAIATMPDPEDIDDESILAFKKVLADCIEGEEIEEEVHRRYGCSLYTYKQNLKKEEGEEVIADLVFRSNEIRVIEVKTIAQILNIQIGVVSSDLDAKEVYTLTPEQKQIPTWVTLYGSPNRFPVFLEYDDESSIWSILFPKIDLETIPAPTHLTEEEWQKDKENIQAIEKYFKKISQTSS